MRRACHRNRLKKTGVLITALVSLIMMQMIGTADGTGNGAAFEDVKEKTGEALDTAKDYAGRRKESTGRT